MAKVYQFQEQLKRGNEVERILDKFFTESSYEFTITPANMKQQRRGIDRLFQVTDGRWWTVEYKADFKTVDTGNAYIETVSVGKYDEQHKFVVHKEGWALTSCADTLVYYPVGTGYVHILNPLDLRSLVKKDTVETAAGIKGYRSVSVQNQGYQGRGLLVPMTKMQELSESWRIEE